MLQYNLQQLKNATIDFYNITHLLIVLFDEQFNIVHSYPQTLSPFCTEVRRSAELRQKCFACDRYGLRLCKQNKELFIYQCHMGLTEAIAPIMDNGEIIGYLMLGQTLTESNRQTIAERIDELKDNRQINKATLHRELGKLVPITHEFLFSATRIMEMCSCYLCAKNIVRAQQDTLRRNVECYVQENLSSPTLSMQELCRKFSVSRSTLYAMSKDSFHMGISDYIRFCRIERAKKLLLKNALPIYEISQACGFSAPNYFTKTFKQIVGVLPKDFCKQNTVQAENE